MSAFAVGIDLGTTYSAVACLDERGEPAVLPNTHGHPLTPSAVTFDDAGKPIVGEEAKERLVAGDPQAAVFFKRQMGVQHYVHSAAGRTFDATDLSSFVLARLKADAEAALAHPITDAVITVPAYFGHAQRQATIEAGRRAGLNVLQVINEPTAAAIAYGWRNAGGRDRTFLVYDLGGGTFDVTLLQVAGEEAQVLTSLGDHELGGKDWDERILDFLLTRFAEEHGITPRVAADEHGELLLRAEVAKRQLSSLRHARVTLVHGGRRGTYELDRATFEDLTRDLLERTVSLTQMALESQSMSPEDLDGVVLVGGSSRMPMVQAFVERTLGRPILAGVNVDEAVALGAAIVAGQRSRPTLLALAGRTRARDVTNHSLGMIAVNDDRSAFVNSVIMPKNTPIPCDQARPYRHATGRRPTSKMEVFLTQGESARPQEVDYLGRYVVHDIPPGKDDVALVQVRYRYDASETVTVEAAVDSQPLRVTVEALPPDVPGRFQRKPDEVAARQEVTAYLAFDLSGSMSGRPLEEARAAARSFVSNSDLGQCAIGIIAFADSVRVKLEASRDAAAIEAAIAALSIGETGGGNSAHPFDTAHDILAKAEGARFIVTLADGVWSHQSLAVEQARRCHAAGIESIAVGFGSADRQFLRDIASSDEGSFFTTLGGLVDTFTTIAQVVTQGRSSGRLASR